MNLFGLMGARRAGGGAAPEPLPLNIVFEGDSISAGVLVTSARSWPNMYGGLHNYAINASLIAGAAPSLENRAATVDSRIKADVQNVLVVSTGNDMIAGTAANMLTLMASYLDDRRAAGWYVVLWSVLPRTTGGFNAKRATANAEMATWVGTHCDEWFSFDGTAMGADVDASDVAKFSDGIHPTLAGNRLLLAAIKPMLDVLAPWGNTTAPTTNLFDHWKLNTGLTQSGGFADAWRSRLRALDAVSTLTARPAVQGDGSLLFDGSNDFLFSAHALSPDGVTLCVLAKQITWATGDGIVSGVIASTAGLFQSGTTPEIKGYNGSFTTGNTSWPLNTFAAVILTIDASGCVIQVDDNPATTSAGLSPGNMFGLAIGAGANGNQFANCQIKEVLVYRGALDATARAAVRAYFATVP